MAKIYLTNLKTASKHKIDYEEFAKSMYEQSLALMPEDIGVWINILQQQ